MKNILLLLVSMFFIGTAFAQKETPGIFTVETPDYLRVYRTEKYPEKILYIEDAFCEPIVSTIIDSTGFLFSSKDCVYGPCTVYYIYFENQQMKCQRGTTLFPPKKPDSR